MFKNLLKKSKEKNIIIEKETFFENIDFDRSNFKEVFSIFLGKMMILQNNCSEIVVKDRNWSVDFEEKIILFGEDKYPLQFIGSEANSSETWMWAWNNINNFSEDILEIANNVKEIGENWKLAPFVNSEIELDDFFNGQIF